MKAGKLAYRLFSAAASLNLALALLGLLALSVAAGGTLPQATRMNVTELNEWQANWPLLSQMFDRTGLSEVYSSWWFYALCVALLANLLAGVALHVLRIRGWLAGQMPPTYRACATGDLPEDLARELGGTAAAGKHAVTRGWLGLLGTPLFHFGIVVLMAGAMASASERFGARLELSEGETFSGEPEKLSRERYSVSPAGDFGQLRLDRLDAQVGDGRYIRELQAFFTVQERGQPPREAVLSVNNPMKMGRYKVYLNKKFGYAAAFGRIRPDGSQRETRINFEAPRDKWGGGKPIERQDMVMLDNVPILYNMALTPGEVPSMALEASRRGQIVFRGTLLPGQMADLGAYRLVFLGTVPWVGMYLTTDSALWVVFAGFVIALSGFFLHLIFRPRRLRLAQGQEGWELEAWAMRDDWRFERQWRRWQAQTQWREA